MIPKLPKGFTQPMSVGEGSFSSVYRARQSVLERWVAVKILPEKNRLRRQELLKEAKTQAQMPLRCIPDIYDAFEWGRQVCIVMEWIKGVPLSRLLEKELSRADRIALASGIVSALAGLHRLGFAHRDLKPANILVSPDSGIHLVDMGFAKNVMDGERSFAGGFKGTPAYMAPELWQQKADVDFMKADLYALGKILRQLSPGRDWDALINPLLDENPAKRPADAGVLWDSRQSMETVDAPDWKAIVGSTASDQLVRQLLQAAGNLIIDRRKDEAYWLIAECLSEDPDSAEAMRLMEKFTASNVRTPRKQFVIFATISLSLIAAVLIAFHFGRQAGRAGIIPRAPEANAKELLLPRRVLGKIVGTSEGAAARLREIPAPTKELSATVMLVDPQSCDSIFVDGRQAPNLKGGNEVSLAFGNHEIACLEKQSLIFRREKIVLLPFQKKFLRLSAPLPRAET